jgi:uncharacterized membrane protein
VTSQKTSWVKWAWVLGWPVVFIGAFVASTIVHDPAKEEAFSLAGTSTAEDVLFLVGAFGVIIWIVGCLILLIAEMMKSGGR